MDKHNLFPKLYFATSLFFSLALLAPRSSNALTHLTTPLQITSDTTLNDDYECDTTCFIVKGNNFTFDFNGHAATFGNANTVTVPNDTFSTWTDNTTPANWTMVSGTAAKTASIYPFGQWDAVLSPTASLKSTPFTLKGGKTYMGFAFAKGSSSDSYTLELKRASDDAVLFTVTVTGLLSRGYADEGQANTARQYKPTVDTSVYLQFTGIGTNPKIIGMISVKPAFDYGIIQDAYQHTAGTTAYEPDGPNYYGASSNVAIKNGTLTQGAGDGVRTEGIRYAATNWTIQNMTINMAGINTMGINGTYSTGGTITGNTINSISKSVFHRMYGTAGIFLSRVTSNYKYTITNNTITGVPQYGIFNYSCFTDTDATTYTISGNTISQNELVTEGYAIGLSGIINATVDSNTITPIKGRGILIDSVACSSPSKKGTKNVTISNNNILGLYETRNAEYAEDGLEVPGIRVRNWGDANGAHENLTIRNNTITAHTDANGVHRAYGININASSPTDSVAIYENNVNVSASGTGKDANAFSMQSVDMTTGGILDVHNNTFTSTHQAVRFGGNDGSSVKGVTLRSNTLAQTGTPTVAPIAYGYWIGPETGNSLVDTIFNTSNLNSFCWDSSGLSDLTVKWSAKVTVKNALNQAVPGATVTATDSKLNTYVGITDSSGFVNLVLPEYKKEGTGSGCSTAGLTTTTYAPYTLVAEKDGVTSTIQNYAGTSSKSADLLVNVVPVADTTPPAVTLASPINNSILAGITALSAIASDNVGVTRIDFLVNGVVSAVLNTAPYSYNWNTTADTNGSYTITAKAYDAAGNVTQSSAISVTVSNMIADTVVPVVTGFAMPLTASSLTVAITSLTATDNIGVSGYMIRESSVAPTAGSAGWSAAAPTSITFSAAGSKTAYAWAKDAVGNVSLSANQTVVITLADTTPPTVYSFTMPATSTSLTAPITSFSASDNVGYTGKLVTESPSKPSVNAAGWSMSSPASFTFSSAGTKTAYAWAKDAAGNVSASSSATVTITLQDVTAPAISAFTMPAAATSLTVAVSSFTATDSVGVAGYMVTESSSAPAAGTAGWTASAPASFTFSAIGSKTAYAWAKDAAGNVSASRSAAVTITSPPVSAYTIADALLALRIVVGSVNPSQQDWILLDVAPVVNGKSVPNGQIDISDALTILTDVVGTRKVAL